MEVHPLHSFILHMELIGTIRDKQLVPLEEKGKQQLIFRLVTEDSEGNEISVNCHAWNEQAGLLNRQLSNGAVCEIHLDTRQNAGIGRIKSLRVLNARTLKMPPQTDPESAEEPRRVPVAWGLWRAGKWFVGLNKGKQLRRDQAISFDASDKKARPFLFDECKDQQQVLASAFGCRTIIKPLRFK